MVRLKSFKSKGGSVGVDVNFSPQPETGTPEGRFPIGNGWYSTPEQIDPRDCENYPDSPWCGGVPWTRDPIGIGVEVNLHPCGVDVNVSGTLAYTKLPTHGISYRFEGECRNDPPKPSPPTFDDLPKPQNLGNPTGFNRGNISESDEVWAAISYYTVFENWIVAFEDGSPAWIPGGTFGVCEEMVFDYRSTEYFVSANRYEAIVKTKGKVISKYAHQETQSDGNLYNGEIDTAEVPYTQYWNGNDLSRIIDVYGSDGRLYQTYQYGSLKFEETENPPPPPYESLIYWFQVYGQSYSIIIKGRWGLIKDVYDKPTSVQEYPTSRIATTYHCAEVLKVSDFGKFPQRENPPPPFNDDPDKDCCMTCCNSSNKQQEQNNDLLKKILKKVENIEKRTGCDEFPVKLPSSLRIETNWLSSILPGQQATLQNIPQMNAHIFKLFEEIFGQWDLNIQIKDVDPATPGDQPKGMKIPNISEAFGEVIGTMIQATINTETTVNMLSRCMYEAGLAHQMGVDNFYMIKCLIDYFGFKTKEVEEKVPMAFTPGKDKLEEMLVEYEHKMQITKFDDPKQTYKHDMLTLLQMAAAYKAQNVKGIDLKDPQKGLDQIMQRLKALRDSQNKQEEQLTKKAGEDFDAWVERYERGFTDIPNIDDSINPYGEPLSQRPRVVRLDKQTGDDNTPSS